MFRIKQGFTGVAMDIAEAQAHLGIGAETSLNDAKAAYRMRARLLHPDRVAQEPEAVRREAERAMAQLNEAWAVMQAGQRMPPAEEQFSSRAAETRPEPPGPNECEMCGAFPAMRQEYQTQTGLLIGHRRSELAGRLCRNCGLSFYRESQAHALTKGWWGIIAVFRNFLVLVVNRQQWSAVKTMEPPQGRRESVVTPIPFTGLIAKPIARRPGPWLGTIAAAVVVAALIGGAVNSQQASGGRPSTSACSGPRADVADDVQQANSASDATVQSMWAHMAAGMILQHRACFGQSDIDSATQIANG